MLVVAQTSPALLEVLMAGWRVGALVAPTDVALSGGEIGRRLDDFRPDLVVVDDGIVEVPNWVESCRSRRIHCCSLSSAGDDVPLDLALPPPEAPALCIYTSGSTGAPKGVVLSHAALVQGARNVVAAHGIGPDDRALCVLPLSHLNGLVTTFLAPILSGGSVVYMTGPFQPCRAATLIDSLGCTWFSAVPTHYALLVRPPLPADAWSFSTLKFCRSASAPLPLQILADFEAHYRVPIIETMGMTETAGQIFTNARGAAGRKAGSVGRPLGFETRIVDDSGHVCADGGRGEIQIRGAAMMSGYLDDPDETGRAFTDGWLRSGDIGWRDADGFHFITGRKKEIAIFAGSNISLRAIDDVIRQTAGVSDGACASEPSVLFGERITCYAVASDGSAAPSQIGQAIAEAVRDRLPSAQALGRICIVADMPRSPVGKLLRGRLSAMPIVHAFDAAPWTTASALVAHVLKMPEAAVEETLHLGAVAAWDSLAHVALTLELEARLGRQLSVAEVYAATTVRGLRRVIAGEVGDLADAIETPQDDLATLMVWNGLLPRQDEPLAMRPRMAAARRRRVTEQDIVDALTAAGLRAGDAVIVHSDITAIGATEAGWDREAVLELYLRAFRRVLGDDGTLCVCTSFEDYGRYGTPFVWEESPSRLGAFSEFIRTRPGAVRSLHPIVSVTSLGGRAFDISGGPHFDGFGHASPWGRLHYMDAMVMTLGMLQYPEMGLTFIHYIEQLHGVPYQYNKVYAAPVIKDGRPVSGPFTMSVRYLDYGITYDTNKFKLRALERGVARQVELGGNGIFAARAAALVEEGMRTLSADRYFFLKSPPTFRPGELPMDGATGTIRYAYDKSEAPS